MPVAVYGYYGFALLLVPTAAADYLEYERFQLIDALAPHINSGKVKVFSINSINNESWLNNHMDPRHKIIRHKQFNEYVFEEVIPFIKTNTSADTPIIISGASFGALHSMNLFLQRPDLLNGVIAMSGVYDLTEYTKGYYDEDVYFNSPQHYMPNLSNHGVLEQIRRSRHIHLFPAAGLMKIRMPAGALLRYYIIKVFITNWMYGEASGRMIGIPGVRCYRITCQRVFKN